MHHNDNRSWCRVRVLAVDAEAGKIAQLDLYYADYGYSDFFQIGADASRMELLRRLPFDFLRLPFQAIRCTLDGIEPLGARVLHLP